MSYFIGCPDNANFLVKTSSGVKLVDKTGNVVSGHQVKVRIVQVVIDGTQ